MKVTRPTLEQLVKGYERLRPSCTPSRIDAVRRHLTDPVRHSMDDAEMRGYLQWRLHVTSKQLDSLLLASFVDVYADDLLAKADEEE